MYNEAIEDYLKAIYSLQSNREKVSNTDLSRHLKITPASATGMIKRLSEMKLVTYQPYQGVILTDSGRKIALEVIRHHRLIELFLAQALGLPWDKVHDEAERWEHVISEEVEERIDEILGFPTHDPHGSPIPSPDLKMPKSSDILLIHLKSGQKAVIVEVKTKNSEMLRYLGTLNLYPKTAIEIMEVAPFEGPVTIAVGDKTHVLGRKIAQNIYVEIQSDLQN